MRYAGKDLEQHWPRLACCKCGKLDALDVVVVESIIMRAYRYFISCHKCRVQSEYLSPFDIAEHLLCDRDVMVGMHFEKQGWHIGRESD